MGIRHIISLESDTVTEKTIRIPFEFSETGAIPADKNPGDHIMITPITVRTWFKLKPLLLQIDKADFEKLTTTDPPALSPDFPEIMSKYDDLLLDIICLGIHNRKTDPPAWFRETLKDNTTWEDIGILLKAILFRIGYTPFYNSIMTLKSMSPLTEAEMIAAQNNLKSWIGR